MKISDLTPGDQVRVKYIHSSANCESTRTDLVTVDRLEAPYFWATNGYKYHESTIEHIANQG